MSQIDQMNFARTEFTRNVNFLLQQNTSKLRPWVSSERHIADAARVENQLGTIDFKDVVGTTAEVVYSDVINDSRWVYPNNKEVYVMSSNWEKLQTGIALEGKYAQGVMLGANRAIDKIILEGALGINKTGYQGATAVTIPSSQIIDVSGGGASATGLNVDKLIAVQELLAENNAEDQEIVMVIHPKQHANLLKQIRVVNKDYSDTAVLERGKVRFFMGIYFVESNQLPKDENGYYKCFAFIRGRIHLGIWEEPYVTIEKDIRKSHHPYQVAGWLSMGATRLEEKALVLVPCA